MRNFLIILLLICIFSACQRTADRLITITGLTMGTTYSVKLISDRPDVDKNKLRTDIELILAEINQSMSTYIPDSELSLLNQNTSVDWAFISDDLFNVIEHAHAISITTKGAFDITVGPLVNLWGFGPHPFSKEIPTDSELKEIRQHVGYEKIHFDASTQRILKTDPNLYIDLSAIAKGFAVDKIALYLDKNNIHRYLVEIGGELIAKGLNDNYQAWQIGIEQANTIERTVQQVISLDNIAMATSGDYRNYFEKDGIRYSHTIDPTTGKPIHHNLASVTVLHQSTMYADALATAFMVLGTEKTHKLANELGIAVYTLSKSAAGFNAQYNDYFKPYLSK